MAFCRLKEAQVWHPDMPELPLPVRFVFVLILPRRNYSTEARALGRSMGALIVDDVNTFFHLFGDRYLFGKSFKLKTIQYSCSRF